MPEPFEATQRATEPEHKGCLIFEGGLADYLEGQIRPDLARHARECEYCAVMLADLELISTESRTAGLEEGGRGPSPRVWANIRAALESEGYFRDQRGWRERFFSQWWAAPNPVPLAAMAVVLLAAAVFLVYPWTHTNLPLHSAAIAGQQELQQTVAQLEQAYRERATSFEPAVKQGYEKGLESLNASIEAAQSSLDSQPDNDMAREYLLTAYEQKADVLASALEFNGR